MNKWQRNVKLGFQAALTAALVAIARAQSPAGGTVENVFLARDSKDVLVFRNGDYLYGGLLGIDPQSGLRWQHPDAAQPIEFSVANLAEIQLAPRAETQPPGWTNNCTVRLVDQDELEGSLTACDAEKLTLETWYAGRLTIPRKRVEAILVIPSNIKTVFDGPTGVDGWTIGKVVGAGAETGQWKYKNGAFYATRAASIARDLKLPPVATLQFDLAWKGSLYIALALYTDYLQPVNLSTKESEPDFGAFYSLQLNNFYANLLPISKLTPLRYLGQISVSAFNQKNSAHVEVKLNKEKRQTALFIDGVLLKEWVDPENFTPTGTGLRLVNQGLGAVKLSHLQITEWDGLFDEKLARPPGSKDDLVRLRNADKLTGAFEGIHEGKMTFVNAGKTMVVPLDRIKEVDLAPVADAGARATNQVRAVFNRRGSVTFALQKWDAHQVVALSPDFGQAELNPAAFSRLEFGTDIEPVKPKPVTTQ